MISLRVKRPVFFLSRSLNASRKLLKSISRVTLFTRKVKASTQILYGARNSFSLKNILESSWKASAFAIENHVWFRASAAEIL